MDSLIVDLDKVLDDFEAEESTGKGSRSGTVSADYANFLAKNNDNSWEEMGQSPADMVSQWKTYGKEDHLSNVDYGEPYEPISNFDLSEADFAPSVKAKSDTIMPKLNSVISNGHDESLSNDKDGYHIRSDKFTLGLQSSEVISNGLHNPHIASESMQNVNNSQMIDLHGCDSRNISDIDLECQGQSSNGDDQKRVHEQNSNYDNEKFPIQVVDIFTPVSEDAPKIPNPSYLQSYVPITSRENDMKHNENINVKLNESVPVCSVQKGVSNSAGSDVLVTNSISGNKQESQFAPSDTLKNIELCNDFNDRDKMLNESEKVHLKDRESVQTLVASNTSSNKQVNVPHSDKKNDEGYDSYDYLSKDSTLEGLIVRGTDTSIQPSLGFSEMISDQQSSQNHETNTEIKDSLDETLVKTLKCESELTEPNVSDTNTKHTEDTIPDAVVLTQDISPGHVNDTETTQVIGFGQDVTVDDQEVAEYLKDMEDFQNCEGSMDSKSLSMDSSVNVYPPNYSSIDKLPKINNDVKIDAKTGDNKPQNTESAIQISDLPKEHQENELMNQFISSQETNSMEEKKENIAFSEQYIPAKSLDSMNVQSIQMPSVEMGGARRKDANWHTGKPELSVTTDVNESVDHHEDKHLAVLDESQQYQISKDKQIDITNTNDATEIVVNGVNEMSDDNEQPIMRRSIQNASPSEMTRPHSWGPSGSDHVPIPQQKRPNSLNLPQRGERSQQPYTFPYPANDEETTSPEINEDSVDNVHSEETQAVDDEHGDEVLEASGYTPEPDPTATTDSQSQLETALGKSAPMWIPDNEAPVCMSCDVKFTFTKRRHHCRACGKVFCSNCCNLKSRLEYMENKEARVCIECHRQLTIAELSSSGSPNPSNPSEYCSVIPPSQQASARSQPPSVLVPASVLKREGSTKQNSEGKHVMFSDGIRPGGDLTELDGSDTANRLPLRRSGRSQKKIEKGGSPETTKQVARRLRGSEAKRHKCLIPETGLPPIIKPTETKGGYVMEECLEQDKVLSQIKDDEAEPVIFALNSNLFVLVKIINLDCCVNRVCWCFTTRGMCNVGQDEIVFVLEVIPDEEVIPIDIMRHFYTVFEDAGKGNTVTSMGHTIFNQPFLDSRDHGGILYIRPTFQCLHKLLLPNPPYVFAILLQKWETPWAKVFPLRLLLRLGAEYRYYPCPLISVRNRKPVFFEIGHTIMNLLADFRNFQYMLPQIKGVTIHMEDKKTAITFPRNRYEDIMKVVSNSNEHVMALGASFSLQADSHLVCIQNDDGNYQTQAINIQNKPRKVTGASFVVFNGALKTSSGLKAKSSIVEDGLMVQITPDSMVALKQALKDMSNYTIECGSQTNSNPDEVVSIIWGNDDKNINIGVKSPIDDMSMDGIESIHIPNATDYVGEKQIIRWTDVFFIQNKDSGSTRWEPVDLSRLAETLSNATCIALTPHLDKLKEASLIKIGLRVNIEIEKVGYEIGSNGERLPDLYMNDLDNELIPVIHSAASQNRGGAIILELIFHILD